MGESEGVSAALIGANREHVGARALRWVACGWCVAAALVLVADPDLELLDTRPGGSGFVDRAQPAALVVFALGALAAWVWPIVGAALLAFATAMVAPFAAGQLEMPSAALGIAAFAVPALVLGGLGLARMQRRGPRGTALALGAIVLVAVVGAAAASDLRHDVYGATHPSSSAPRLPDSAVRWVWSGGVTSDRATVTARLREPTRGGAVRLAFGHRPDLADARRTEPVTPDANRVVRFDLERLEPGTEYHYAVEGDGVLDQVRAGRFRTFGTGPQSFTVAFGGCARVGSNGAVFDAIRALDPSLFVILGDWHYGNVDDDDPDAFREVADITLESPGPSALYRSTPIAYVWDDHDYGANNADSTSSSRAAAMQVYRQYVPHYPLAGDDTSIHQAFTVGRVRFVVTDARSGRDPADELDDADKTMLGHEQRRWLERELLAARDTAALIVWVNPVPWIEEADDGADAWGGYSTERRTIANFIAAHRIDNLVMVSGDAHMVAIDDGRNTDYATEGDASFPLLHAAPLDRRGRKKGGPYSEGAIARGGQFGVVEIDDSGRDLTVRMTARDWRGNTLLQHEVTIPAPV